MKEDSGISKLQKHIIPQSGREAMQGKPAVSRLKE
jgi:hypothetical protein